MTFLMILLLNSYFLISLDLLYIFAGKELY